jgi:light-regulated signal transduction histidine kinase (bacteriophytochrome)
MPALQLDFLVEAIAKALCFEKFVALVGAENPEDIDVDEVLNYYRKNEDTYIDKAQALLIMVEDSEDLLNTTFH